MIKKATDNTTYRKIIAFSKVLNVASLFGVLFIVFYEYFRNYQRINSLFENDAEIYTFVFVILLVIANSISSYLLCNFSIKLSYLSDSIQESHNNLDKLNNDMRKQRHDFLNNLQVIHGLISMDSYSDAKDYIDNVYSDIRSINRFLKTDSPAINALLQAKLAKCEDNNIHVDLNILSTFKDDLPMPEWLVCRILGNLIDNAIDAILERGSGEVHILLSEDVNCHYLSIEDNGITIIDNNIPNIFNPGFSTKGDRGTGMGLAICRDLLSEYQGTIDIKKRDDYKIFLVQIPKHKPV